MSSVGRLRAVLHEDRRHGVAVYARALADAVDEHSDLACGVPLAEVGDLPAGTRVHLHFTDRLWAASPEEAAEVVRDLGARHPLAVTLHDLPQPSDGERNLVRRSASYRAVVRTARLVVCNSAHEAALLREYTDPDATPVVIPLPVDLDTSAAAAGGDESIGVLGFFYPGKGHDEALAAMRYAGASAMTLLGRASPGHEPDLSDFVDRAAAAGVSVRVTGYLDDAELVRRSRQVAVPVLAHRHVSASGSLGSWIAAGRRPIATANRYTTEMAALRPGTLTLVDPGELGTAIAAALADPPSTWLSAGQDVPYGRDAVAEAYIASWAGASW